MKGAREPSPAPPPALVLDADFTSDEILGDDPPPAPKRKAKRPPPPPPPSSESEEEPPPPPPPKLKRERTRRPQRAVAHEPEPQPLNPPSYLEVLQRGLKEARAKQHAEKIAQYDKFFQW